MSDWPRLLVFAASRPAARFALATLVARSGSSYRPPGARLLVADDGAHFGCLSGGCLEDEVAAAALRVLATGRAACLEVDTRPHFGCPGRLSLLLEPLPVGWLDLLAGYLRTRRPFAVRSVFVGELAGWGSEVVPGPVLEPESGLPGVFLERLGPEPRVIVVGGTSDTDPVLGFGARLGWEMHRVLPAGDAGRAEDSARGAVCAPEELSRRFPPDAGTAVVIMTHHLARDLAYLRAVLPEPYPYVGLLGSRRRREELLGELGEAGLLGDEACAARLHAPVGLDLGATDPASVALAIVAEIQACWAGRPGGSLRARPPRGPTATSLAGGAGR